MKNLTALVAMVFLAVFSAKSADASADNFRMNNNGNSYIFVEGGVEFSVFPDGQFDFVYVGNQGGVNVDVYSPNVNVSFNSGYNYDAFVQYDDYGAVIQVEDVPIYYDNFGRIIQAGSVEIRYTNRRIVRVGGMRIFYNNWGYFDYYTGFISPWYRTYIYRPWHVFYAPPLFASCVVWDFPYRRWYTPYRYSWGYHQNHWNNGYAYVNGRRDFYRPGSRIHHRNGRSSLNPNYNPNRVNRAVNRYTGRDTGKPRGTTRGIARNDNNSSLNSRGNSRGIARTDKSVNRGIARNDNSSLNSRNGNSRGIAKKDRPSNRGIAKTNRKGNSIRKGNSRGIAKNDRGNSSFKSRPSSRGNSFSKPKTNRNKPSSVNRNGGRSKMKSVNRGVSKRSSNVSRSNSNRGSSVNRNKSFSSPKRSAVKRNSSPSRSKSSSVNRNSSSRSKGSAPKRGRGRQ